MSEAVYTFDINTFSDLHKDAYGFRPSERFYVWMDTATNDELQAEWDSLLIAVKRSIEEDNQRELLAISRFEQLVSETIERGAADRETALRWIMDASSCNGDWELLCYEHGLPYGYFKKAA